MSMNMILIEDITDKNNKSMHTILNGEFKYKGLKYIRPLIPISALATTGVFVYSSEMQNQSLQIWCIVSMVALIIVTLVYFNVIQFALMSKVFIGLRGESIIVYTFGKDRDYTIHAELDLATLEVTKGKEVIHLKDKATIYDLIVRDPYDFKKALMYLSDAKDGETYSDVSNYSYNKL